MVLGLGGWRLRRRGWGGGGVVGMECRGEGGGGQGKGQPRPGRRPPRAGGRAQWLPRWPGNSTARSADASRPARRHTPSSDRRLHRSRLDSAHLCICYILHLSVWDSGLDAFDVRPCYSVCDLRVVAFQAVLFLRPTKRVCAWDSVLSGLS